jgi:hypothetical protein
MESTRAWHKLAADSLWPCHNGLNAVMAFMKGTCAAVRKPTITGQKQDHITARFTIDDVPRSRAWRSGRFLHSTCARAKASNQQDGHRVVLLMPPLRTSW